MSGQEPIIELKNFTFRYRAQKKPTLHDINLRVMRGEKILIAGPSGSGKSTLGSCLNGLIPFSNEGDMTGELTIKSKKPVSVFQLSDIVGTVLQDTDGQFVGLSSAEDIAFALENSCLPTDEMKTRVLEAAKLVGAEGYLKHSPQRLSGGEKQRVSMAGVLVGNAEILLLDEPLAALDPMTGKLAVALIDEIATKKDCTVIIIEHRIEDVLFKQMDRVILFDNGRIIADGPPDEVVVSPILREVGLREPLYISALKCVDVDVKSEDKPGRLETLLLTEREKEKVRLWSTEYIDEKDEINSEDYACKFDNKPTPLLEVRSVSFVYPETEKHALKDIAFSLYPGEMTAIVGANGAGKSTLAKLLAGFETAEKGEIFFNGENMSDWTIPECAQRIGYVMQNPNQMICKPMIFDEVALGLRVRGVPENEVEERVSQALEVCGLTRFIKWPISALSYGQKKRVTIADALVLDPQILILDEPTAGQDWRHYTDIMEFLVELNQRGITILMITHDMHLCLEYAKRALVFTAGELIADLPAYELLSDPVLAKRAGLRETSLYDLANICDIDNPKALVRAYIENERRASK